MEGINLNVKLGLERGTSLLSQLLKNKERYLSLNINRH